MTPPRDEPPEPVRVHVGETSPLLLQESVELVSLRRRIASIIESHLAHILILVLVLIDLLCVVAEILISFLEQQDACREGDPLPPSHNEETLFQTVLKVVSISILGVFCCEHALRLFALGFADYIDNPLHAFDAAVVYGSLILEITLKGTAAEFAGLLIAARSWRIVRVIDGVATAVKVEKEQELRALREENDMLKQELSTLRAAMPWSSDSLVVQ
ncbi:hypothetical protein HDU87_000881 [Geranomyces variabilis]|uniref:Voltage-gated hydrogen channel 1 n=1 Tax=Geranomyces variabilis TaxID=109894 RepID=A0AAD5TDH6_9FUNG|nr:hypothetical protein HDU87_000881 [Geranomyces variabilis]